MYEEHSELIRLHNELCRQPLSQEELEEEGLECLIAELPSGESLEEGQRIERNTLLTTVDDPFNYGMTIHRGPLTEAEKDMLDLPAVQRAIAEWLDETPEDLARLYGPGGLNAADLELRSQIDEKLLVAVEAGASKVSLARGLGWKLKKPHNQSPILQGALRRAREVRSANG